MTQPADNLHCQHHGCRFKRLGVLREGRQNAKHFLLVCQSCGSTVSTRTLRARREMRKTIALNLSLL